MLLKSRPADTYHPCHFSSRAPLCLQTTKLPPVMAYTDRLSCINMYNKYVSKS